MKNIIFIVILVVLVFGCSDDKGELFVSKLEDMNEQELREFQDSLYSELINEKEEVMISMENSKSFIHDSLSSIAEILKESIDDEKYFFKDSSDEIINAFAQEIKNKKDNQIKTIIKMDEYLREIKTINKIFKREGFFERYFKENNLIRMIRIVPSSKENKYYLIALELAPYYGERKFIIIQENEGNYIEIIESDSALVGRAGSGRMSDMLVDIYTEKDLFTIVFYHGGNWSHGYEFTFKKSENQFILADGIGYSVADIDYDNDMVKISSNVFTFEKGLNIKDMNFGETPEIESEFITEQDSVKNYFKYLNVWE